MSLVNWRNVRPLGKWVLVKADQRVKKTASGIILTDELTRIERVTEGSGRLLRVGQEAMKDVEPGERIMYRGFLKDAFHTAFERDEDDRDRQIFMLRIEDILAVIPDDLEIGCFSGNKEEQGA
jgi:co-chaperonin GroES (HSP10)